jgi:hypothetical protein
MLWSIAVNTRSWAPRNAQSLTRPLNRLARHPELSGDCPVFERPAAPSEPFSIVELGAKTIWLDWLRGKHHLDHALVRGFNAAKAAAGGDFDTPSEVGGR